MKKSISRMAVCMAVLMLISIFAIPLSTSAAAEYTTPTGSGTDRSPYLITEPNQLQYMNQKPGSVYRLENDLDFSTYAGSFPIVMENFYGVLEGNNKVIRNLYIDNRDGYYGMGAIFVQLENRGILRNITFVNPVVYADSGAAALCHYAEGEIDNVRVLGGSITSIQDYGFAGAICGVGMTLMTNCSSTATVTSNGENSSAGGLIGFGCGDGLEIISCYSTGNVTANEGGMAGGLVGKTYDGYFEDCYAGGRIVGGYSGGLMGVYYLNNYTPLPTVENCFWDRQATGQTKIGVRYVNSWSTPGGPPAIYLEDNTSINYPTNASVGINSSVQLNLEYYGSFPSTVSGYWRTTTTSTNLTCSSTGLVTGKSAGSYAVIFKLQLGNYEVDLQPIIVTVQ